MSATVRSAVRVSTASAVWTLVASVASIIVGLADASIALIAFGGVQLFDFAADVVLVVHFRAGEAAAHLERVVLRIVSGGLIGTGTVAFVLSMDRLVAGGEAEESALGLALAALSFVVLAALAARKHQIARQLSSRALRADGNLSAVGAALGAVTLVGVAAARTFDWTWADPVTALVVAVGAMYLGARTYAAVMIPTGD